MTGATFLKTVPEMISRSAWRGDPRRTSAPKRAISYRGVKAVASSTKQQERPKNMGHRLYCRAQLIRLSIRGRITFPPFPDFSGSWAPTPDLLFSRYRKG